METKTLNIFNSLPGDSIRYYVSCDGFIQNLSEPFDSLEKCRAFIESAKERDRITLMLHKRLLKKILKKKVSPDLHDYAVLIEVDL